MVKICKILTTISSKFLVHRNFNICNILFHFNNLQRYLTIYPSMFQFHHFFNYWQIFSFTGSATVHHSTTKAPPPPSTPLSIPLVARSIEHQQQARGHLNTLTLRFVNSKSGTSPSFATPLTAAFLGIGVSLLRTFSILSPEARRYVHFPLVFFIPLFFIYFSIYLFERIYLPLPSPIPLFFLPPGEPRVPPFPVSRSRDSRIWMAGPARDW